MACTYIEALKRKYSQGIIEAYHVVTNGKIYCPICQTTHDWRKENEQIKKT